LSYSGIAFCGTRKLRGTAFTASTFCKITVLA